MTNLLTYSMLFHERKVCFFTIYSRYENLVEYEQNISILNLLIFKAQNLQINILEYLLIFTILNAENLQCTVVVYSHFII